MESQNKFSIVFEAAKELMKLAVDLKIHSVEVCGIKVVVGSDIMYPTWDKVPTELPSELGQTDAVASDEELLYYSSEV